MPRRPETLDLEQLPSRVGAIFEQAQSSTANHQKNAVTLHKLHLQAASHWDGDEDQLTGERKFQELFIHMLFNALSLKRTNRSGDRVIRFVGKYIRHINEKSSESRDDAEDESKLDPEVDTVGSRMTARLLRTLMKGFDARDKTVRYRVLQSVVELVPHLGVFDADIYNQLEQALSSRLNDKEPSVRAQAAIALHELCKSVGNDSEEDTTLKLLDVLSHDPSPDVRGTVLENIPITQVTLPHLFSRTRDSSVAVRKALYSKVLEANILAKGADDAGPTHPHALSMSQREFIVKDGVGDREPTVRDAAEELLGNWSTTLAKQHVKSEGERNSSEVAYDDVLDILALFNLREATTAATALKTLFSVRPQVFRDLDIDVQYWTALTPEKAFICRVFIDHCISAGDNTRKESTLPEVTALAFHVQQYHSKLMGTLQSDADVQQAAASEAPNQTFIVDQLLQIAVHLDYGDEIGRRKMCQITREMIVQDLLPESLLSRCMDVLRCTADSEGDLIRLVVEAIHEIRDLAEDDDISSPVRDDVDRSFSASPSIPKKRSEPKNTEKANYLDSRCLTLCIEMLQRVNGIFEDNRTLEGIVKELITPSMHCQIPLLQEKGYTCLGLICSIYRQLALGQVQKLLNKLQEGLSETLKIIIIEILFDIFMVYERDILADSTQNVEAITEYLLGILATSESAEIQTLLCIGLAKLTLGGMVVNRKVLEYLTVAYFAPSTAHNQELRQCLAYFLACFCYSSPKNQRRMLEVFIPVVRRLPTIRGDMDEDDEMVSSAQVCSMFTEWIDPTKLVEIEGIDNDDQISIDMAYEIVMALIDRDIPQEEKKSLCQLFSRLHLPSTVDDDRIRSLTVLISGLQQRRPLRDATSKLNLSRFEANLHKKYSEQLKELTEEDLRNLETLKNVFTFVDSIVSDDDDDEAIEVEKKKAKRRRSDSIFSSTDAEGSRQSTPAKRGKSKSKRRRESSQADDGSDYEFSHPLKKEASAPPLPPPRTRQLPKRRAALEPKKIQFIEISSDSDEEPPISPKNHTTKSGRSSRSSANDSIFGRDVIDIDEDEDSEVEVNDLLVGDND